MLLASVTSGRMTENLPGEFHGLTKGLLSGARCPRVPPVIVKNLLRQIHRPGARNAIGCPPVPVHETLSVLGKTIKVVSSSQKQVGTSDGSRCAEAVFQVVQ